MHVNGTQYISASVTKLLQLCK